MAAAAEPSGAQLRSSAIGLWDVVFQSITYMAPGVGLVFSIGIGINFTGETLPLAVAIGLLACTLTAVAIGQCAKYIPSAGGIYTYAAKGLNPSFGFYIGWLYVGFAAFLPVFLFTLNGYLIDLTLKQQHWPGESWSKWWIWTILTIIVVFFLTYFDVRISGRAGIILGIMEIAIFVALSLWMIVDNSSYNSASYFNPANSLQDTKGLFIGAVYGILAFIGFEAAAALGEEARDPRRTVPRGVIYSCVSIGLYYILCCYAWNVGAGSTGIVAHYNDNGFNSWVPFGKEFWGSGWILVFLALINSNIACASAAVNNAGRVLFSMGRIGALPSFIGKVHPHHRTPYWGVIVTLILSTIVSFLSAWKFGADFAYAVNGDIVHGARDRDLHDRLRRLHRLLQPRGPRASQRVAPCRGPDRRASSCSSRRCTRSTSASTAVQVRGRVPVQLGADRRRHLARRRRRASPSGCAPASPSAGARDDRFRRRVRRARARRARRIHGLGH